MGYPQARCHARPVARGALSLKQVASLGVAMMSEIRGLANLVIFGQKGRISRPPRPRGARSPKRSHDRDPAEPTRRLTQCRPAEPAATAPGPSTPSWSPPSPPAPSRASRCCRSSATSRTGAQLPEMPRGLPDDSPVFANPDSTPMLPSRVSDTFRRQVAKSGLPVMRLHDARRTHLTHLLRSGSRSRTSRRAPVTGRRSRR